VSCEENVADVRSKRSDDGAVEVDERLQTSVPGVLVLGAIRTGHSDQWLR
jgi:hypothetical protein